MNNRRFRRPVDRRIRSVLCRPRPQRPGACR